MDEQTVDPKELPRVVPGAQFVAERDAVGRPHAVVDGAVLPGTVLCLSHWPATSTPAAVRADTSAEIVDRYLKLQPAGPEIELVTNNHFDEDGLFGIWLLLEQPPEGRLRQLAIDAAEAGDFFTWTDPSAAKCAITTMAMADRPTTPFPQIKRALASPHAGDPTDTIYRALLPRVPSLLADPERYAFLWSEKWLGVEADIALLDSGDATISEISEIDLAVVRAPRFLQELAVYPRTDCTRVLTATDDGGRVLRYRYETWVVYVSRRLPPRVDLAPLLPVLGERESHPGTWRFEGVDPATPRLYFGNETGAVASSGIDVDELIEILSPRLERLR
jgi:hypothetical protein